MISQHEPRVAIVDFGGGNLYNVQRACAHVGMQSEITDDVKAVAAADGLVLPGVGSMSQAMSKLTRSGLADEIRRSVARGTPVLGVCLGFQLLMSRGTEFGEYEGLGFFAGSVEMFPRTDRESHLLRVPHIGWAPITAPAGRAWDDTLLAAVPERSSMYFVHSYRVIPNDSSAVAAVSSYGGYEFTAALESNNIFGCQFHPERSGPLGLRIYERYGARVRDYCAAWSRSGG